MSELKEIEPFCLKGLEGGEPFAEIYTGRPAYPTVHIGGYALSAADAAAVHTWLTRALGLDAALDAERAAKERVIQDNTRLDDEITKLTADLAAERIETHRLGGQLDEHMARMERLTKELEEARKQLAFAVEARKHELAYLQAELTELGNASPYQSEAYETATDAYRWASGRLRADLERERLDQPPAQLSNEGEAG